MVECGLKVCSGATLRFDEFSSVGMEGSVSVVGCVVAMTIEVSRMSIVGCLLVTVLAEGSPLAVDCSVVVVDVGLVCCFVSSVLLAVVVSSVVLSVEV